MNDKQRREKARWRILRILDSGRPYPMAESLILVALEDAELALSATELRRELDYLESRKLVEIHDRHTGKWSADLTHYGVDIVEYTIECEPGIGRPKLG